MKDRSRVNGKIATLSASKPSFSTRARTETTTASTPLGVRIPKLVPRHLFPSEWDRLAEGLDQTHRAALEGYQFGYQSDDENIVSLEKARVTRADRSGAGWTRTSDRGFMSPLTRKPSTRKNEPDKATGQG